MGTLPLPRRFGLLRFVATLLQILAVLGLLINLALIGLFALTMTAVLDESNVTTALSLLQVGVSLLGALGTLAVAELILVLLAIEEHTRSTALASASIAQLVPQQAAMVTALETIARNTRFAADDLQGVAALLQQVANEQQRQAHELLATQAGGE